MTKQVTFNDWEFQVDAKTDYDILTSKDKLVVLDDTNDTSLILLSNDNSIQISYLNYGSKLSINNQNNKLVLEIPYFGEVVIQ